MYDCQLILLKLDNFTTVHYEALLVYDLVDTMTCLSPT